MQIKIVNNGIHAFPYGNLSGNDKAFLKDSIGKTFNAVWHNINYYILDNEIMVHCYDTIQIR